MSWAGLYWSRLRREDSSATTVLIKVGESVTIILPYNVTCEVSACKYLDRKALPSYFESKISGINIRTYKCIQLRKLSNM